MPYKCDLCSEEFRYKRDYTQHSKTKNGCLSQQNLLHKYKEAHYIDPDKKVELEKSISERKCLLCHKEFVDKYKYDKHMNRKNACIQKGRLSKKRMLR